MICLNVILTAKNAADVEAIKGLLAQQSKLSREEPGCLRFEAYHSQTNITTFLLCEHWESQEALDAHRRAKAYTEIYQPQILPKVTRVPHPSTLIE